MNDSVLYPPNRRALSDAVISDVMQRRAAPPSSRPQSAPLSVQKSQLPSVHLAVSLAGRGQVTADSSSRRGGTKRTAANLSDEVAYCRARNREHQARHKMKQLKKMQDLETSIRQLREEVQELRLQHEVLSVGVMSNTTVWNVVAEYFCMFRYGVQVSESPSPSSAVVVRPSAFQAEVQRSFLRSTMEPSVKSEMGFGVDALMENCGFVSKFHPDIDVELTCLENDADGFMVGRTLGRLTVTENTLRHAFPHLIDDGEGGELAQLAHRLLGQQLVMRGAVRFEWDSDNGRIARVQHKADLLTPILELLGSLEAISQVFDHALVTPDSTSAAWGKLPAQ